jgi:NAD(P)-dependent dehydrogenase (short-subunit alcohol dehydrogenase family)
MSAARTGAIVITGASSGIGQACALHLDRLGFQVFAGVRKEADGEALRHEASARLQPILLDIIDPEQIAASVVTVSDAVGTRGLAGLVNNAGVGIGGPLEFIAIEELRRQLEINVVGQVAVTQAFLPLIRAARGRIVMMGSISGRAAAPFLGPYSASKFALEALTDTLRMELHPWGIEVVIVEPGTIATPIWEKSRRLAEDVSRRLPPEALKLYGRGIAGVQRWIEGAERKGAPPSMVARAVEHALTAEKPKTRYLVGRDARLRAALQYLPDRLRDRLILSQM